MLLALSHIVVACRKYIRLFQYIRKMTRLMNDGKLPDHVDPDSIVNAPPSKKHRASLVVDDPLTLTDNQDESGDAPPTDTPVSPPVAQQSPADVARASNETEGARQARTRRRPNLQDSDTSDLSSMDNILSDSGTDNESNIDLIRSSSPSCDAQQDRE